jgi:hypothetical protein
MNRQHKQQHRHWCIPGQHFYWHIQEGCNFKTKRPHCEEHPTSPVAAPDKETPA